MKLYTEEQVKEAMDLLLSPIRPLKTQVLQHLTPIELPSDEEIEHKSIDISSITSNYARTVSKSYYKAGAKWMKEQILNQNK